MRKNSFIKTLFSVCSGTDIFIKIIKYSIVRSLWHLLLLCTICSLIFILLKSPSLKNDISSTFDRLQEKFGGISVKENGLFPVIQPNQPKTLSTNSIQIDYFPDMPTDKNFNIDTFLNRAGFIWMPTSIITWSQLDSDNFFIYQIIPVEKSKAVELGAIDNIYHFLNSVYKNNQSQFKIPFFLKNGEILEFSSFSDTIFFWISLAMFVINLGSYFICALLYSLLFALFYIIIGKKFYSISFKSYFLMAIYAGFPGIIIGAVLIFANIPWFQYQTIYLICMIVYLIFISQKIRALHILPPRTRL